MDTRELIAKAHALAEEGRQSDALACCDQVLAAKPGSSDAWLAKGAILLRAQQYHEALCSFEKAQHFGDQRAAQGNLLCRMALAKEAASQKPEQTAEEREAAVEGWYNKGAESAEQGRPEEALASFEKALEIKPQSTYAWYAKATVLGQLRRPEDAIASYDCALVINPEFALALYSKGVTLISAFKRYPEALECFEKAQKSGYAEAGPAIDVCKKALAQGAVTAQPAQAVPSSSGPQKGGAEMGFEELMEKTKALLKQGQPDMAITVCILALAKNPDSPEAWNIKGSIMMAKNDFRGALECFENAQRVGGDPRAAQGIAMCRAALGEAAAPASGEAPSEPVMTANAWFYKGEDFDKQGNSAEALACFEKALEIDPNAAYTWYSKGVALGKLGRPDEELASYDQALRVNPQFPEAWFNKAITLGNARRFREALECFIKAQQLGYPDAEQGVRYCQNALAEEAGGATAESDAWLKKGTDLVVNGGSAQEALACFEKAVALNPRAERAWWGKGVVLGNLGRLEEAIAAYDQAFAVNPSGTGPLNSKAAALYNASRFQEALACYEKARELGDPQAIQGVILCRQSLGLGPNG